jgi:hypothetical protein
MAIVNRVVNIVSSLPVTSTSEPNKSKYQIKYKGVSGGSCQACRECSLGQLESKYSHIPQSIV